MVEAIPSILNGRSWLLLLGVRGTGVLGSSPPAVTLCATRLQPVPKLVGRSKLLNRPACRPPSLGRAADCLLREWFRRPARLRGSGGRRVSARGSGGPRRLWVLRALRVPSPGSTL